MTVVSDNYSEVTPAAPPEAGQLLRAVSRLFGEVQQRNFACCDVQGATRCSILSALHREGDQTLSALTRRLNLDKAWLSRSTDELAAQGLLVKAPHPTDRRALHLTLTLAGTQAAQTLDADLSAQAARVLARLPQADQPQALRLLSALAEALEAELQGEHAPTCTPTGGPA